MPARTHVSLHNSLLTAILMVGNTRVLADAPDTAPVPANPPPDLASIVITATRVLESSVNLPVSIDRIDERQITLGQLEVNLSETLDTVPGTSAQNRQNYAQDLQLSVLGFGARSQFGVRSARLYSDCIPGTMPDAHGQFSQFDLISAGHIEVLRGPFSARYYNSLGGVISVFTEDGKPGFELTAAERHRPARSCARHRTVERDEGRVSPLGLRDVRGRAELERSCQPGCGRKVT